MRTGVLPVRAARRLRARTLCRKQEMVAWNRIIMHSLEVSQRFIERRVQRGSLVRTTFELGVAHSTRIEAIRE